jgi:hypothetical protein
MTPPKTQYPEAATGHENKMQPHQQKWQPQVATAATAVAAATDSFIRHSNGQTA